MHYVYSRGRIVAYDFGLSFGIGKRISSGALMFSVLGLRPALNESEWALIHYTGPKHE